MPVTLIDEDRNLIQMMKPAERQYWKRGSAGSKLFPTALSKPLICLLVRFHQNHDWFSFLAEQWKTCKHLIIMQTDKNEQHQSLYK